MTTSQFTQGSGTPLSSTIDANNTHTPNVNVVGASISLAGFQFYPSDATPLVAASGNQAATDAVATLAKEAAKTVYITGFEITASGATTAVPVTVTVVGVLGGTLSYTFTAVAGVLLACQPLIVEFPVPIPASGTNVDIVVTLPSLGTGNTHASVVAHGYKR